MKPTEFVVENSIIAQEADDMHRDHEVQMARSQMYSAAQAAIEIHRLLRDISEMEGLEGWVQSKLTLASQYLESVRDYMKYEAVSQEPEMMAFAESAANYAIESLLAEDEDDIKVRKPGGNYVDPDLGYAPSRQRDRILSTPKGEINPDLQRYAERNVPRKLGDEGQPGIKSTGGGFGPSRIERPEGIPKVSKTPITRFGMPGPGGEADPRLGADLDPKAMMKRTMREREEVYPDRRVSPPIEDRSKSDTPTKPVDRTEVYPDNKKPPIEDRTKKLKERLSNLERKIKEQAPNANLADTGFQPGTSTVKAASGQIEKDIQASNQLGGALGSIQSLRQGGPNTIASIAPGAQAKVTGMQQDKAVVDKRLAIAGVGQTPAAPQSAQKTDFSQYRDDDVSESKKNKKLREMATGGSSSSSGMATSMSGPARKSTSGVPKRVGNSYKPKRVAVGKGVYNK